MNRFRYLAEAKLAACLFLMFSAASFAQNAPPVAPVREVTDEYFGQKIVDPYRCFCI
jgi:hypothetical protein